MKKLKDIKRDEKVDKIMEAEDIRAIDNKGDTLLKDTDPKFLGTKPIHLSNKQPIQAVNMFLPPGVSRFFVERLDKNHIRFLIATTEVERLAEKAEKIMEATKKQDKDEKGVKK